MFGQQSMHDVVVRIRYTVDKEGKTHEVSTRTTKDLTDMGDHFKVVTKRFVSGKKVFKETTDKLKGFNSNLLTTMFFGASLVGIFTGLTSSSMEMMGVWDILGAFLGVTFLPIAMLFMDVVFAIWDAFDRLPAPVKDAINIIVLLIGIFGTILTTFSAVALAAGALGVPFISLGAFIAALLGPIGLVIAAIAILAYAWSTNMFGIRDATMSAIENIKGFLSNAAQAIMYFRDVVIRYFSDLVSGAFNWGSDMISRLIQGINSLAGQLATAFWNLLPKWVRDILTGVGMFAGSIFNNIRSAFGMTPMATGGIVTRPTPALIGERGPEAVIPLDRIGSIGGIYVTINTSTIGGNTDALARDIAEKFRSELVRVRY